MPNNKKTIAIDIDDVLADNAKGFVAFSNSRYGTNLNPEDYNEHWTEFWGVDREEAERRANEIHSIGLLGTYDHDPSAKSVLVELKAEYNLIIITSRRIQSKRDTILWIERYYSGIFDNGSIHFAGIWDLFNDHSIHRTKGELCKSLNVDFIIDDQLKHCFAAGQLGIKALLFGEYSWNHADKLPDNVNRVTDWQEVSEYFNGRD